MYKHILIPTDGSELANKAVEHGIALAKAIGARITVLTVMVPFHIFTLDPQVVEETSDQYKQRIQLHATATLSPVAAKAKAAGVPCDSVYLEHEHVYQASLTMPALVKAFLGFFGFSLIFLNALLLSLRRVVLFVPLNSASTTARFVIFRSVSVRPRHLIDQTSTMISYSNSLCRERDAHSLARCATSHHAWYRAVPRANRTRTTANTHIRSATSNTTEFPNVDPWLLSQCSCAYASPGACTDAASVD